ncbi:MAG: glycosyl transferase [Thiotrichales bacterium]|nr:MAG: glycosyl transferase [Thiotrichales bacterium]
MKRVDDTENIGQVLVVIPAFNEEKSIGNLLTRLFQSGFTEIVVVDDASTDNTLKCALESGVTVLPLRERLGAWGAAQTGIRYGCQKDYQFIITVDADGQHPPESIEYLVKALQTKDCDVLIGSCPERGSVARHIAWWLFRKLSGASLKDITSGLRVYNKRAAKLVAEADVTLFDYQDIGVLLYLLRNGMKIDEIEVIMEKRLDGKSRIFNSWGLVVRYMLMTLVICVSLRKKDN